MSQTPTTYFDSNQHPFLFCPGCGHGKILDALNKALVRLAIDPHKLVIVTDIGCAGLSDRYFQTNAFHGLHGRSITYATGIKLSNPELTVLVLIGDGGCGIGGHHLLNAARRNIGVATIVFNNLNYGMTGGQHSVTTPAGSQTSTTPLGQWEQPMDICSTMINNGASFVARSTTFEPSLPDIISKAITNNGFSLVDIWELCTAHFAPGNRFGKKELYRTLQNLAFPIGILFQDPKPEYSAAYREIHQGLKSTQVSMDKTISSEYRHDLRQPLKMIIAGAAGGKVASAASLFAQAAIHAGLYVSQRNDYPVTVKSGHSISEIILAPQQVKYTGIDKPDMVIVLSTEGLKKMEKTIARLSNRDCLLINEDLPEVKTRASRIPLSFQGQKKESHAIIALTAALDRFEFFPTEALHQAIVHRSKYAKENLAAYQAGMTVFKH